MAGISTQIPLHDGRKLDFSEAPLIMGILNCTPDSFYPSSRHLSPESAVEAGLRMVEEGASILDVGGESTRPGAPFVEAEKEIDRIYPVIEEIRKRSTVAISVDTRKSAVAQQAVNAGADIVNDVSGLRDDPELAGFVALRQVPVVLMHMRGTPVTMQERPHYGDAISEVSSELAERVAAAISAGVMKDRIIIDPGIGFGKRVEDNLRVIAEIDGFHSLGYPVLLGASRKSFIDKVLDRDVDDRLFATLGVHAWAALHGVEILRVHDVAETYDLVRMIRAIEKESV